MHSAHQPCICKILRLQFSDAKLESERGKDVYIFFPIRNAAMIYQVLKSCHKAVCVYAGNGYLDPF